MAEYEISYDVMDDKGRWIRNTTNISYHESDKFIPVEKKFYEKFADVKHKILIEIQCLKD